MLLKGEQFIVGLVCQGKGGLFKQREVCFGGRNPLLKGKLLFLGGYFCCGWLLQRQRGGCFYGDFKKEEEGGVLQ